MTPCFYRWAHAALYRLPFTLDHLDCVDAVLSLYFLFPQDLISILISAVCHDRNQMTAIVREWIAADEEGQDEDAQPAFKKSKEKNVNNNERGPRKMTKTNTDLLSIEKTDFPNRTSPMVCVGVLSVKSWP